MFFAFVNFECKSFDTQFLFFNQFEISPFIICEIRSKACRSVDFPEPFNPTIQLNFSNVISKSTNDLKLSISIFFNCICTPFKRFSFYLNSNYKNKNSLISFLIFNNLELVFEILKYGVWIAPKLLKYFSI